MSSTNFAFFGRIGETRRSTWPLDTFSTSLKQLDGIQRNLTASKNSTSFIKFAFFMPIKKDSRHSLWLAETFSTFHLKPQKGIERNLTGSRISISSTKSHCDIYREMFHNYVTSWCNRGMYCILTLALSLSIDKSIANYTIHHSIK